MVLHQQTQNDVAVVVMVAVAVVVFGCGFRLLRGAKSNANAIASS